MSHSIGIDVDDLIDYTDDEGEPRAPVLPQRTAPVGAPAPAPFPGLAGLSGDQLLEFARIVSGQVTSAIPAAPAAPLPNNKRSPVPVLSGHQDVILEMARMFQPQTARAPAAALLLSVERSLVPRDENRGRSNYGSRRSNQRFRSRDRSGYHSRNPSWYRSSHYIRRRSPISLGPKAYSED